MRGITAAVLRVGRATTFVTGVCVLLVFFSFLVLGVTSAAFAANGKPFVLGRINVASAVSTLKKQGPGPALNLLVRPGQPPLAVNSNVRVTDLNADRVDSLDSADFQRSDAAAGGDLTGSYPDPEIASGAVGEDEVDPTDVQLRTGACPSGQAIRSVQQDGSVSCQQTGQLTGFEQVITSSPFDDSPLKTSTAACPTGKVAISGGVDYSRSADSVISFSSDDIAVTDTRPSPNLSGSFTPLRWTAAASWVGGDGRPPFDWRLITTVVCVDG